MNVISVDDITGAPGGVPRAGDDQGRRRRRSARPEIVHLADVFRARVVDVAPDSLIIEITGSEDKIDGLLEVLRPYGVLEMARTGRVAMTRSSRSNAAVAARPAADSHDPQVSYSV